MKKFLIGILMPVLLLAGCAKAADENMTPVETLAFEAWVNKHVIGRGIDAVKQPNGMYVEFVKDGTGDLSPVDKQTWVMLDYTATDIDGNVFITSYEEEALRQRSFTPYTHYVPDYMFCSGENTTAMIEGQYYALRNKLVKGDGTEVELTKGSEIRIYMPSYLALGTDGSGNDQGYGGQYQLGSTKIVIEHLKMVDVVENPLDREELLVNAKAAEWGKAEADTLKTLLFLDENFAQNYAGVNLSADEIKSLNEDYPFKPRVPDPARPGEYTDGFGLTVDSTAVIRYIGRFLDGFIFDTNIQQVNDAWFGRNFDFPADEKTCYALSYTPVSQKDSYWSALYYAVPEMRRGKWYRLLFTSAYAYGATGMSKALQDRQDYYNDYVNYYYNEMYYNERYGSSYYGNYLDSYSYSTSTSSSVVTEIQPYTPLIFEIYIETE